jgi:hypothetical protein
MTDSCKDRPANVAAVREIEAKLSNTVAERAKQDAQLWGSNEPPKK